MEKEKFPVDDIHQFWFGDCIDKPEALIEQAKRWFTVNEAVDLYIKQTFGYLFAPLLQVKPKAFKGARSILAAILVLDQFSRNAFRSTPKAFEYDRHALRLLDHALEKGWDGRLVPIERAFLFMPLQHSESMQRQKQSTRMFKELVMISQEPYREYLVGMEKFAQQHRLIIERFGRFPHRNVIMGRRSDAEETAFLKNDLQRFGQPIKV